MMTYRIPISKTPGLAALTKGGHPQARVHRGLTLGLKKLGNTARKETIIEARKAFARPPKDIIRNVSFGVRDLVAHVIVRCVYAAAQEYGATIKAFRAKLLAIPLTKEAKLVGGPRSPGGRAHFGDRLRVAKSRAGHLLLVLTKPRKTNRKRAGAKHAGPRPVFPGEVPQYALVPSVRLRARGYFGRAMRRTMSTARRVLLDEVRAAIGWTR
jgi:hypothetical protein